MFSKALIAGAFATLAAAQSTVLTFTHVPNPITDGEPQAITYATNDTTSPVTIILRKGVSNDLQTVETLTTSATNGQYIWTPSKSLANDNDYALEITQGTQVNYFGPFSVQGANPSAVASASSSSASASASGSASSYVSSTVSANGTASTTIPVAPGTSVGTGSALPRNTTMSMATLTSPSSNSATATSAGPASTAAGTTGAGFQSSSTQSAASSSSTSGASAVQICSTISLFAAAFAAVVYLQ